MVRVAAAICLRLGLVFLGLAALVRLFPMPNKADLVGDDLALFSSGLLVLITFAYLRFTKEQ